MHHGIMTLPYFQTENITFPQIISTILLVKTNPKLIIRLHPVAGSKLDDFMFSSSMIANTDEEIEYDPRTGRVYCSDDDIKLCDNEYFIKMSYRQCKRLQMMRLQEEEFVLLKAVCLYAPGKCVGLCETAKTVLSHRTKYAGG